MSRRLLALALAGLVLATGACSALKDREPFTVTVTYQDGPDGTLVVSGPNPKDRLLLTGDSNFGLVQVVNESAQDHGFAIDDLAVFERIPSGRTKTINVPEARDDRTYVYYCHLHGIKEFAGKLKIDYVAEELR